MPGLREALEEKFDEFDTGVASEQAPATVENQEPVEQESEPVETAEEVSTDAERARDDHGRFAPAPKEQAKTAAPGKTSATRAPAAGQQAGAARPGQVIPPAGAVPAAPVAATPAPQALKPAARELWGKLPPEFEPLKQDWFRREKETAQALQRAAESGKSVTPLQEAIRPFENEIRASGAEPARYVGEMLQTLHAIRTNPNPLARADVLADAIVNLGQDLLRADRQDDQGNPSSPLDRALAAHITNRAGQMPPGAVAPSQDPRQVFQEMFQEIAGQHQAKLAEQQVATFAADPKHEFFPDVAEQMEAWLLGLDRQGRKTVSDEELDRAYNGFCMAHPEISTILEQRREAKAARTTQATTSRARAASSSIRSQPVVATATQSKGLRSALEQRYDELDEG